MKKRLIIYPNWLPSNSVGVQRVRLITNFINDFGWEVYLLTVNPDYIEEEKCTDLLLLQSKYLNVELVNALSVFNKF